MELKFPRPIIRRKRVAHSRALADHLDLQHRLGDMMVLLAEMKPIFAKSARRGEVRACNDLIRRISGVDLTDIHQIINDFNSLAED